MSGLHFRPTSPEALTWERNQTAFWRAKGAKTGRVYVVVPTVMNDRPAEKILYVDGQRHGAYRGIPEALAAAEFSEKMAADDNPTPERRRLRAGAVA